MSNGSERVPERPKITNWIENVPVRGLAGEIIGRAKVSDKGEVRASIDLSKAAEATYNQLASGMCDSLSVVPSFPKSDPVKYSDEVRTRLAEQNPFNRRD